MDRGEVEARLRNLIDKHELVQTDAVVVEGEIEEEEEVDDGEYEDVEDVEDVDDEGWDDEDEEDDEEDDEGAMPSTPPV